MLTHAPNTCIYALIGNECCDVIWVNSIFMAFFNSCLIFSKLRLFFSSTSLLHYSLSFPIISSNYCGLINIVELLEPCDAFMKYWLIVTLTPATWTRPGWSGHPITVFSISWQPCETKLPCVICSCNESCNKQIMLIYQMMLLSYKLHVKMKMN